MIIRTIAALLLAHSFIFGFQSNLKNSPLPAKSKAGSPAEEKWWNDLREKALSIWNLNLADIAFQNNRPPKGDHRNLSTRVREMSLAREELLALIKSGKDNNYQAPVEDRKITILTTPMPGYTEEARSRHINGIVEVEAQFLADGRIANAHALNRLYSDLDKNAVATVYKIVFIPAIENGHFKDFTQTIKVSFSLV